MAAGTGSSGNKILVMVRYGELFLKSDPVKYHFIGLLLRNIRHALASAGLSSTVKSPRGRIFIFGDEPEKIAQVVSKIFGVVDVSVVTLTGHSPEDFAAAAVSLAKAHVNAPARFAVRGKRQTKVGMNSQQLGEFVGSAIYDAIPGLTVDLTHPEYELFVEVRDCGCLVYDSRVPAPGGLPWGSQGKVLGLLSSGIDSPVASWLAMKRGCEVAHLHVDGGRWAGSDVRETAIENHRRLSLWCAGNVMQMLVVNSEPFYDRMQELRVPPRLRCVLCKRFMLRVAGSLCEREGAGAVLTGENLGQVASQTLANLAVISDATTVPVLRPLITYDKAETITLARKIGTFMDNQGDLACRA
ncbi:MAG: tRNA sulfurtransferase, partial [Methanoregula sp.]|nr:tRNA sulfurtransferase [Methanoregula sp.]